MYFDIDELDQKRSYKLLSSTIVPRPIAWVVTRDKSGATNAAPYSLFNFFSGYPPVVCVGMGLRNGEAKDSLAHIQETGEFVVNLVNGELVHEMNTTATPFPRGVNELEKAALKVLPSMKVRPPRIAESPVALECSLRQVLQLDQTAVIVVANVQAVHIADQAVVDASRCYVDASKLGLIGRMESPGWYTHTHDRFKVRQLDVDEWEQANRSVEPR